MLLRIGINLGTCRYRLGKLAKNNRLLRVYGVRDYYKSMNVGTPRIEGNGKISESLSIKLPETKRHESNKQTFQTSSRNSMSSFNLLLKSSIDFPSSRASKYFGDSDFKIPDRVETYRQTLMEEYKVKGHRRMKRFQSNGILPLHANILRKDSLLDVEINKK